MKSEEKEFPEHFSEEKRMEIRVQDKGRRLFQAGRRGLPASIFLITGFFGGLPFVPEHTFFGSQIGRRHFHEYPLRAGHFPGSFSLNSHAT